MAYLLTVVGGCEFDRSARRVPAARDQRGRSPFACRIPANAWVFEHYRGRYGEAILLMREARPIAVEAGDRYTEADTLVIEAMATACVGPLELAQRLSETAIRLGLAMESDWVVAFWQWRVPVPRYGPDVPPLHVDD